MTSLTVVGSLSLSLAILAHASAATTLPATTAPGSDMSKITYQMPMTKSAHFSPLGEKVNAEYNQIVHLMLDRPSLVDPTRRQALLQKTKPLLLQWRVDAAQLAVSDGNSDPMVKLSKSIDADTVERLAMLGDPETTTQLSADAADADVTKAMKANCVLLECRWKLANDFAEIGDVMNTLEKLDRAHPDNADLAALTYSFANESGDPATRERLFTLGSDVMTGPAAERFDTTRKIMMAAKETKKNVGQPFTVAGLTPEGKPFTTADWKGKVILVDFWATWCGPCKAELPEIKKLYAEYHDKGFEIVGVSNDFSLAALQKYVLDNDMPWPQLVDADAVKKQTWNPMTLGYGIDGIPRIFVINKRGELIDDHATYTFKEVVAKAMAE